MTDKLTLQQLEELAHELYKAWRRSRTDKDWQKYLEVKEKLDKAKGLT